MHFQTFSTSQLHLSPSKSNNATNTTSNKTIGSITRRETSNYYINNILEIVKNNIVIINLLIYIIYIPELVNSVPLIEKIPKEAAKDMEGLIQYLPDSVQALILTNEGFTSAFLQSLLLILACELGDRTFFVAAILAMKSSRIVIWSGAILALSVMTILSAAIGKAFPLLFNKKYTSVACSMLFFIFGLQLLKDWWKMRKSNKQQENEELIEVEEELKSSNTTTSISSSTDNNNDKNPFIKYSKSLLLILTSFISPVFLKAFSMTALAEWGDRSQIATIALAASNDMYGVIIGGILGHSICTGLAVIGGRLLATSISEKAVALMGGILFISFALLSATGMLQ